VDFDIRLGDAECVPVSLTDNQVECRPPTDKPSRNFNDSCQDDTLSTDVSIVVIYYETVYLRVTRFSLIEKADGDAEYVICFLFGFARNH